MDEEQKLTLRERLGSWLSDMGFIVMRSFDSLNRDNVPILASGLVYSTLVAFVPCFTFICAIVQLFGVLQPFIDILLDWLYAALGEEIANQIVGALSALTSNGMGLGVFGLISFVFTTILLVNKVYTVINGIFRASPRSGTLKRFTTFFTFVILTAVILAVVLAMNSKATEYLSSVVDSTHSTGALRKFIEQVASFFLIVLILFALFYYVPNAKVRSKSALLGAVFGAIALSFITLIFKYIVALSVGYSVLYGSLSAVFFLLLYLYFCWYVIIIATEFTYVYQFRPDRLQLRGIGESPSRQLQDGINLLMLVASSYRNGEGGVTQKVLMRRLLLNQIELDNFINIFLSHGFLLETVGQKKNMAYVPAKPLDQILVRDIVSALYAFSSESIDTVGEAVSEQFADTGIRSFGNLTLENLLERV